MTRLLMHHPGLVCNAQMSTSDKQQFFAKNLLSNHMRVSARARSELWHQPPCYMASCVNCWRWTEQERDGEITLVSEEEDVGKGVGLHVWLLFLLSPCLYRVSEWKKTQEPHNPVPRDRNTRAHTHFTHDTALFWDAQMRERMLAHMRTQRLP